MEIPAYTLSILALLKTGRRMPLCLTMVIGGVACLCTMIFEKGELGMLGLMYMFLMKLESSRSFE